MKIAFRGNGTMSEDLEMIGDFILAFLPVNGFFSSSVKLKSVGWLSQESLQDALVI